MAQVELLHHENFLQFTSVSSVGTDPGTEGIPGKLLCCILDKNARIYMLIDIHCLKLSLL